ncbi:MAG: hypothetical protein RMM53_04270 [Bacteroidia bacterium]|nr:hypothetical protein [Bacteroidia bacterium]
MFFTRVTVVSEWRLSESGDRYESVRFGVAGAPARLALDLPKVEGFSLKPLAAHLVMTSLVDGEGRYLHGSELPVRESGKVALQALSSVTKFPNPLLAYRFSLYAICRVAGVGVVTNFERPVVKTGEIIKYPTMKVLRAITTLDSWMRTTVSFKKDGEDRYTYIDLETPADYVRGAREAVEYLRRASQTTLADIRLESFGEDHQFHVDAKDAQDSSILLGKFDE